MGKNTTNIALTVSILRLAVLPVVQNGQVNDRAHVVRDMNNLTKIGARHSHLVEASPFLLVVILLEISALTDKISWLKLFMT